METFRKRRIGVKKRLSPDPRKGRAREIHRFWADRNNFNGWLRARKMDVPEGYPYKTDLCNLREKQKQRLLIWLKMKSLAWRAWKHNLGFVLSFQSSETRNADTGIIISSEGQRNFQQKQWSVNKQHIRLFHRRNKKWNISLVSWYSWRVWLGIQVAVYELLRGGSFMPLPIKLQNKKAILNIQTETTSAWDGHFEPPYFQRQEVKTR